MPPYLGQLVRAMTSMTNETPRLGLLPFGKVPNFTTVVLVVIGWRKHYGTFLQDYTGYLKT